MSNKIRERLDNLLGGFRAAEPPAPDWAGGPDSVAVLRAWTAIPADIGEPLFLGQPPIHLHNRWPYAWKYRRVDHAELARRAGLPEPACRDMFVKLVAARLIYPDGTLSKPAADILTSAQN
jgi:hypothetical protein